MPAHAAPRRRVPYGSVRQGPTRRWRALVLAGVGAALIAAPASTGAAQGTQCEGAETPVTAANVPESERVLLCLVNVYRTANGSGLLTHDAALRSAARGHSQYMEDTGTFAHEGIGDGTPQSRANAAGYPYSVGENVAVSNFPGYSANAMFGLWQGSPGHNANMLDPGYVTSGMGFAVGGNHGLTGTQMFGTGDNGATDTARDLLTSPRCESAESGETAAEKRVERAKKKRQRADTKAEKKRAKKKLRKAKRALSEARAASASACDLDY